MERDIRREAAELLSGSMNFDQLLQKQIDIISLSILFSDESYYCNISLLQALIPSSWGDKKYKEDLAKAAKFLSDASRFVMYHPKWTIRYDIYYEMVLQAAVNLMQRRKLLLQSARRGL